MNCSQAHDHLPALLYGDLETKLKEQIDRHVADCAACRREFTELKEVRRLLDTAPAPAAAVDVALVYRQAAERQERRLRRWRGAAVAFAAVAAALAFVAVGLKLEVRIEPHQVVLRWGQPPETPALPAAQPDQEPIVAQADPLPRAINDAQVQLLTQLIQALAADVESREQQQQQTLAQFQRRLLDLQNQADRRWTDTERSVAALYAAQFVLTKKGNSQ